jgi:hypothetical protein
MSILELGKPIQTIGLGSVQAPPVCISGYKKTIQGIFNRLQLLLKDSEAFHRCRSEVFIFLNIIHTDSAVSSSSLPKNDKWLSLAEKIENSSPFKHHPASQARLIPLAKDYIIDFQNLEKSLLEVYCKEVDFTTTLQSFSKVHEAFASMYNKEIQSVWKHESQVVRVTDKSDIDFFVIAFLNSIQRSSYEKLNELNEKIASRDTEFVFSFPRFALEYALQMDGNDLPQIFLPCKQQIEVLNENYKKLSLEERDAIRQTISGNMCAISTNAKQVYDEISTISSVCQAQQAKLYSALLSNIYSDIEKSINLAKQINLMTRELAGDHLLNYYNTYMFILYCGISCTENSENDFDFFKQRCICELHKRYEQFTTEEKIKIRDIIFKFESAESVSKLDRFIKDLKFYSNELAFSKEASLLVSIFQLFK